jgi:poly-gamma-glutamate synthesis protein (capsule biosynthesis protein)
MKISFFGDTVLDRVYKVNLNIDIYVLNMEAPLSCIGEPAKFKVNLCQDRYYIKDSFGKNPIAVSLANNHIMDFGEEAFLKTIDILDEEGVRYFGAGTIEDNFSNPAIIDFYGKKIALFGYVCKTTHPVLGDKSSIGSANLELNEILKDIKSIRDRVDFIIVQPHWGVQEIPFPKYSDRNIAHTLIDNGVDLIIGHHAHVIQSFEKYNGKYIFYGLGNFIFPDIDIPTRWNGKEWTAKRVKKQEIENRTSLVVELDREFNISYYTTLFENGEINRVDLKIPTYLPESQEDFGNRLIFENRKGMIKRFLRNPKVPNINHLKEFFKV